MKIFRRHFLLKAWILFFLLPLAAKSESLTLPQAVQSADLGAFQQLVKKGAKLKSIKPEESLLHFLPWTLAYTRQQTEEDFKNSVLTILSELLKAGNDVDSLDSQGQTLLTKAAGQGFPEFIQSLVKHKANTNFIPAKCANKKLMKPSDAFPDVRGETNRIAVSPEQAWGWICKTPLLNAVYGNNLEAVKILLAGKAKVNLASPYDGLTPLMAAAYVGNPEMVQLLLEAGANVQAKNFAGQTASAIAQARDNSRAQALIDKSKSKK